MNMVHFEFKIVEIIHFIDDYLDDFEDDNAKYRMDENGTMDYEDELHDEIFNGYGFSKGNIQAIKWLDNDIETFVKVQKEVKEYCEEEFGSITIDITNPSSVVDMYAYIVGKELLSQILQKRYKKEVSKIIDEKLTKNEPKLIDRIWKFFNYC